MLLLVATTATVAAHPLPKWDPTYNMSLSTMIMPCEYEKFITDPIIRRFGVVDLACRSPFSLSLPPPPPPSLSLFLSLSLFYTHVSHALEAAAAE
jgi:hypothetical protein